MTDNDIIKALDCCGNWQSDKSCDDCPANTYGFGCANRMAKHTLDLINRQNAENERLTVELVGMRGACESYKMHYDNAQAEIERLKIRNKTLTEITKNYDWKFEKAKSEAIKEFAERLKADFVNDEIPVSSWLIKLHINNLAKEMTERKDEGK